MWSLLFISFPYGWWSCIALVQENTNNKTRRELNERFVRHVMSHLCIVSINTNVGIPIHLKYRCDIYSIIIIIALLSSDGILISCGYDILFGWETVSQLCGPSEEQIPKSTWERDKPVIRWLCIGTYRYRCYCMVILEDGIAKCQTHHILTHSLLLCVCNDEWSESRPCSVFIENAYTMRSFSILLYLSKCSVLCVNN